MRETENVTQKSKRGLLQAVWNVLGVVLCVLFIPIIILNVIMIVRSYTDPDHIPFALGYSPVIVLSGSMSPTFEAGDMILLRKVDTDELKVGDVICFTEEETVVTHRIMEIQATEDDGTPVYITKGDANNVEDLVPIFPEQVQGIYTGTRLPGVGNFAYFLQTPQGMLIFIGGPILLLVLWDVFRRMVQGKKAGKEAQRLRAESVGRRQELEAMEQELERLRAQVSAQPGEQEEKKEEDQ